MNLCARKSVANVKREPRRGRTGASGGPDAVRPVVPRPLDSDDLVLRLPRPTPPPPHGRAPLRPASDARCLGLLDRVLELASLRPHLVCEPVATCLQSGRTARFEPVLFRGCSVTCRPASEAQVGVDIGIVPIRHPRAAALNERRRRVEPTGTGLVCRIDVTTAPSCRPRSCGCAETTRRVRRRRPGGYRGRKRRTPRTGLYAPPASRSSSRKTR